MSTQLWLISNAATMIVSMILTGLIIPQILLIAFRRQLFDTVDERKIHQGSVPRLGGIAFVPAIILSLALTVGCGLMYLGLDSFPGIYLSRSVMMCFSLCGLMVLYLVGISDDLVGLKYRAKFVAQIVAALLLVVSGLWMRSLDGLFGIYQIWPVCGWMLTVLIVVFVTNSINLIDGIDGLASGLSAIALLCYGIMFFMLGHYVMAMVAFATLGTLVPFFFFNVMGDARKRKKIFMGDTGALTVGFILAMLSIEMTGTATDSLVDVNPLVMAVAPLLLPCFDVIRVFVHRVRMKHNPFLPDRSHIHHKLLALGMPQRYVMASILLTSLVLTGISIYMSMLLNVTVVLLLDFAVWVVFNYVLTRAIERRRRLDNHPEAFLYT